MHSAKGFLISLLFLQQACIHLDQEPKNTRIFKAPKGMVWETLIKVLKPYPLKKISEEDGVIETELIRVGDIWKPIRNNELPLPYTLSIHLYKQGSRTKVIILKQIRKQRDFFSKTTFVPSDFMEEGELIYRITRELKIRKMIKKLKE